MPLFAIVTQLQQAAGATHRRLIHLLSILALVLLVPLFVLPLFQPDSLVNCRFVDVDILTGRTRSTLYLLYVKVYENVEDTALSRELPPDLVAGTRPEWRRVYTGTPWSHSPRHDFHSATFHVQQLARLWEWPEAGPFTRKMKRNMALRVLDLWQSGGSDFQAGRYLDHLWQLVMEEKEARLRDEVGALER